MISNRSKTIAETPNFMYAGWLRCHQHPYEKNKNPDGIINLGVSENKLVEQKIMKKLTEITFEDLDVSLTHYCKLTGTDDFRESLSGFFNEFMEPRCEVTSEDVFVMNGCGTVVETLAATICDEGEALLVPAPYYATFKQDVEARFDCKLVPIKTPPGEANPFQLTSSRLENAYNLCLQEGVQVRGLLLSNPINPLGTVYSAEELQICLDFCLDNSIHLICDEIYTLSVYDNHNSFSNILSLKNIEKYSDIVHVVWGFSKDFGLSGFRCGVAITFNQEVKKVLGAVAYYTSVPTSTQYVLNRLIADADWIREFQEVNHKRLGACRDIAVKELTKAGIPFIYPNSGLFLSFDVSSYMKSFDDETELYQRFLDNGVFLLPGKLLEFSEPGWFRIIISNPRDSLACAMKRIVKTVQQEYKVKTDDANRR